MKALLINLKTMSTNIQNKIGMNSILRIFFNSSLRFVFRIGVSFLMLFLCFLTSPLQAQEIKDSGCYNKTRSGGVAAMDKKDYDKAIQWFEQAKGCSDKPSNNDLDKLIKKCNDEKKKQIENRKKVEEQRRQQAEEKRIQDEREQWEREQEEEKEAELSRSAYMKIVGVKFFNEDEDGNRLSKDGDILYAKDIKYLRPILCYQGLADDYREVVLFIKIIKPD